jgi:hypothetical protein
MRKTVIAGMLIHVPKTLNVKNRTKTWGVTPGLMWPAKELPGHIRFLKVMRGLGDKDGVTKVPYKESVSLGVLA